MADSIKRFEEWEHVDCNKCVRYWDSSCDGASKGTRVGCNSYLATRDIVIPAQIKRLERRTEWLEWAVGIISIILGICALVVCFNG